MTGLLLLLALQQVDTFKDRPGAQQPVDTFKDDSQGAYSFGVGPDLGWWSTRLGGTAKADGMSTPGTPLDLTRDLNLPASRGIPIYGGGTFYIPMAHDLDGWSELRFTAEYWSREWKGWTVLPQKVVYEEATFAPGTAVDSRLRLASLDLAASVCAENTRYRLLGGASLLPRGTVADLKIASGASTGDQDFGDLFWGLGLFGEYRPWDLFFVGISLKGYTTFGSDFEAGQADLKAYAGVEWRFFRLEGGIRYLPYAESSSEGHSLHYDLYGGYVGLSLFIRF